MSKATGGTPVAGVPLGGGADLDAGATPEPAVDIGGLQVGTVAAGKVALAAGGPDVTHVTPGNALLHELVLLGGLQGHGVHAVSPADVARVQPVHLQVAGRPVLPAEEVRVRDAPGVSVGGVANTCIE